MKFLSPYDAYKAFVSEDYSTVEDMCEPDGSMSLRDIVIYTFQGINTGVNVYDDYDDSLEGASFPVDYDRFDGMQDVIDINSRIESQKDVIPENTPSTNELPSPTPES